MSGRQRRQLIGVIAKVFPRDVPAHVADLLLGDENQLERVIRSAFLPPIMSGDQVADWQAIYRKFFAFKGDFSTLALPPRRQGFDRLIIVAAGMSPGMALLGCSRLFRCYGRDLISLNAATIGQNVRETKSSYAVWVRDWAEADPENANLSAIDIAEQSRVPMTLCERLLYEMKYFLELGQHLDACGTYTMCAGTQDSQNDVPCVCHDKGGLYIGWLGQDWRAPEIRSRTVVT